MATRAGACRVAAGGQIAPAQTAPAQPAAAPPRNGPAAVFTAGQLEQVAAPIALYPDPLVPQVLMASTYPLEVVRVARFDSVKSLVDVGHS